MKSNLTEIMNDSIKKRIEDGSYEVDSQKIAGKIIENALSDLIG